MKSSVCGIASRLVAAALSACLAVHMTGGMVQAADPLANVKTRADLDAVIAATAAPATREALTAHAAEIVAAAERKQNVDELVGILTAASATFEKANATPQDLRVAFGGPSALFDDLKAINLAASGLTIKEKRKTDPFDQAFYERLGKLTAIENLIIINTTAENDWLVPLAKLKSLKMLRIINQSKLDDAGLAHLAPLNQLESFGYIGTKMTGAPFRDFRGWSVLKTASFRGSQMSDAGLEALCDAFPNLQSLVLAHGHFSDTAVARVASLTQLKGLEIGSPKATPQCLKHIVGLPLEYLQLGDGLDASAGIAIISQIKTLKRLTLTNCKNATDDDLRSVAGMKSLEHLETSSLDLPPERLPLIKEFAFLKSMRLLKRPMPYDAEMQAKLKELLPHTALTFE